jgi:subtilisin
MSRKYNGVSRRTALKVTGGSVAAITTSNIAAADPDSAVEVNVGYSAGDGRKAALDAAADVVREFSFDALTVRVPENAVSSLSGRPDVRYVEENGTWQAFACRSCGNDSTRADYSCGDGWGADISIIDTGIQSTHDDLDSYLGAGRACARCWGSDCYCYQSWDDDNGHGTHCAGVAGGPDGVARNATLHAAKVLDGGGSGSWSDIACGIDWTANQGYEVGSLSLGGGSGSSVVRDACNDAYYNYGVLLVAAAGNDYGSSVSYPAAYDACMAVSAVDCNDGWASYSNSGPEVEIAAPGSSIYSEYPCDSCRSLSGTSMATPHVAGAGAILMANGYSNSQARRRLRNTADDIGLHSYRQGDGRLNVERATC